MSRLDLLPSDIQELIYRKKFINELKDELKNLRKNWGEFYFPKGLRPVKVGDWVKCYDKNGYWKFDGEVDRETKTQFSVRGKWFLKQNVQHTFKKKYRGFDKSFYFFDEGSLFSNPIAKKYPELKGNRDAIAIINKGMNVMCDHPLAWLCFEVRNPNYKVLKIS